MLTAPKQKTKQRSVKIGKLKDMLQLGSMAIPTVVLLSLFSYLPMFGIVLAFKNYKIKDGIWGSKWIGWKNFEYLFKSQDAWRIIRNTLGLNFLFIAVTIICAVVFALLMFEVKKARHIKTYQTISILPSFLSWVAVSYIVYALLDPSRGILNQILTFFGAEPIAWYNEAKYWPVILLIVRIWHGVGLGSIMYYAALMGIDESLFEAAELDGANKLQCIWNISIPGIVPIIIIKAILDIGSIFRADFGLFYNVTRNMGTLYSTTDVIDTYVYRALMELGNVGMASAASLVQSVVCLVTIVVTNLIVRKISPENSLF